MKITYKKTETVEVELPNCFCGEEPQLIREVPIIRTSKNMSTRWIYFKCPYCNAHHGNKHNSGGFKTYDECVQSAAEDWIRLIERKNKQ